MAPPLTSPEELNELMVFVGKKVEGVRTSDDARLFNLNRLAVQYKEETGCPQSKSLVSNRIKSQFHRIHEMEDFDNSTKVKMLIILMAPVDAEFLVELRKDAAVEIDGLGRIKKYKAHDGTLELDVDETQTKAQKAARMNAKVLKYKNLFGSRRAGQTPTTSANRGGTGTSGVASTSSRHTI